MSARPTAADVTVVSPSEEAIASSRLEGLEPSAAFVKDARAADEGRLDPDELAERALARHRH